ncbi:ABC transporter ATP-binding protein [Glutamicibacter creatinolyticus]|uniref:ABC transporter ATP-binding protein n=2 Tax=Glutamicibacter creatinolyticus TaxID=162496 RepID=A0A5B7WTE2_9MICC|nr:ABC transporter ATP-binding protein [Glutamicibacter creatinolyticus]
MALLINSTPRQRAIELGRQALVRMGLAGMEQRRIGELSGGQAQRVAIARAQVTGAQLIFADEPTGALDSATGAEVLDALFAGTVAEGKTLVMVTHDEQVASRCDRVVRLLDGRMGRCPALGARPRPGAVRAARDGRHRWAGAWGCMACWPRWWG